jgi:hypothetical protein
VELSRPVVWSDRCLLHEPKAENWVDVRTPATEVSARITAIRDTLDAPVVDAEPHPDDALLQGESPLEASERAFRSAGALLGGLGLPTVVVQEGGYDLQRIGPLVREALLGLEGGRAA